MCLCSKSQAQTRTPLVQRAALGGLHQYPHFPPCPRKETASAAWELPPPAFPKLRDHPQTTQGFCSVQQTQFHPSIHPCIYLIHHPSMHPSIHIYYLSSTSTCHIYQPTYPSIHPSIYISCHLSVHNYELPSIHSSTSMTYPSIYLYHLFIHPFTQQPTHSPTYIFCHLPTYLSTFPASQPLYLLSTIYVSSTIINPYLCVCVSMYPTISSELISKNEHLCGAHILTYWSVSLLN